MVYVVMRLKALLKPSASSLCSNSATSWGSKSCCKLVCWRRSFSSPAAAALVTIHHKDLLAGKDLTKEVLAAYGPNGLGALAIAGVPNLNTLTQRLLPLAHAVAHLPAQEKAALEHSESMYNAGWSHGKEKLGDRPDLAKGSFYGNPLYDQAGTEEELARHPFFYPRNIWPRHSLPELEPCFKQLGTLMFKVVLLLAKQVDQLTAATVVGYFPQLLQTELAHTRKVKGRLLYYFPQSASSRDTDSPDDNWIAWHNDSGFFTALCGDMYVDHFSGRAVPCPDPHAGLYVVRRNGQVCRVEFPPDCLVVQCGECLQIVTGGLLVATPHMVQAVSPQAAEGTSRASFPVFIDTRPDFPLAAPSGINRIQVLNSSAKVTQSKVPPLEGRWSSDGVSFVEFLGITFKQYYEWSLEDMLCQYTIWSLKEMSTSHVPFQWRRRHLPFSQPVRDCSIT
eukprot:g50016.t1